VVATDAWGNVQYPIKRSFWRLGFLADACSGAFYFLGRQLESSGPDISRAAGDYGTRSLRSGVVNLLGVLDAYRIACGRKR